MEETSEILDQSFLQIFNQWSQKVRPGLKYLGFSEAIIEKTRDRIENEARIVLDKPEMESILVRDLTERIGAKKQLNLTVRMEMVLEHFMVYYGLTLAGGHWPKPLERDLILSPSRKFQPFAACSL